MDNFINEKAWNFFLKLRHLDRHTTFLETFYFSDNEKTANKLLKLVLEGTKKATSSCLKSYEIEESRIPKVGDYSIVTNWQGDPQCVIKTTKVSIMPYKNMTYEICKREGEDRCLKTWQRNHWEAFTKEGIELGFCFTKEMLIIFEDFIIDYIFSIDDITSFKRKL
ncbi:MAG: ASCH domain-containing protein [Candidatus Izemoplasmatales bacterium]|jgi:uncharacterized protein YhfF|nr:ASCH domain-containing protein [Candidatus Izemoplasmatales bacterium]MDD3865766.1 ASCH domain-containing protein [Candidatus Izemoplasmatales bacterium]